MLVSLSKTFTPKYIYLNGEKLTNGKPFGQSAKSSRQSAKIKNLPDACAIIGGCKGLAIEPQFRPSPAPPLPTPRLTSNFVPSLPTFRVSPKRNICTHLLWCTPICIYIYICIIVHRYIESHLQLLYFIYDLFYTYYILGGILYILYFFASYTRSTN